MTRTLILVLVSLSFHFLNAQNVGIGTSTPDEKLHILSGKIYIQDNRTNQSPHVIFDNPSVNNKEGGLQWKRSGDTLASINYVADPTVSNYIRLSLTNSGRGNDFIINGSGNVAMGHVDPQAKMHIRGLGATEVLRVESDNPTIQLRRFISANNYQEVGFVQTSGDNLRIGTNSGNSLGKFVVRTGGADRFFIDANGNASLGTSTAATGFKLSVNGKAICEELKIQISGSWPDYVFANEYKLTPLLELENFVTANRHLPNIPKAAEIEKSGMEVGDMQRRMMEKIEELTLYVIDLQKQILDLKKSNR